MASFLVQELYLTKEVYCFKSLSLVLEYLHKFIEKSIYKILCFVLIFSNFFTEDEVSLKNYHFRCSKSLKASFQKPAE